MKKSIFSAIFTVSCLLLSGCGNAGSGKATDQTIDYVTGARQTQIYKKAKSQIDQINKSLEDRYREMEEVGR